MGENREREREKDRDDGPRPITPPLKPVVAPQPGDILALVIQALDGKNQEAGWKAKFLPSSTMCIVVNQTDQPLGAYVIKIEKIG